MHIYNELYENMLRNITVEDQPKQEMEPGERLKKEYFEFKKRRK